MTSGSSTPLYEPSTTCFYRASSLRQSRSEKSNLGYCSVARYTALPSRRNRDITVQLLGGTPKSHRLFSSNLSSLPLPLDYTESACNTIFPRLHIFARPSKIPSIIDPSQIDIIVIYFVQSLCSKSRPSKFFFVMKFRVEAYSIAARQHLD